VLRTFGVHADITATKKEGLPVLSFIGLNGEPSYHDVKVTKVFTHGTTNLTCREFEVLTLLIAGKKKRRDCQLVIYQQANSRFAQKAFVEGNRV
jgi:hypothetical protein